MLAVKKGGSSSWQRKGGWGGGGTKILKLLMTEEERRSTTVCISDGLFAFTQGDASAATGLFSFIFFLLHSYDMHHNHK